MKNGSEGGSENRPLKVGFASLVSLLEPLDSNSRARTLFKSHKTKRPTGGASYGPPGEIQLRYRVRSLVLYPAELRAEWLSQSTGGEVYHDLHELPVAQCTLVSDTLAPASGKGQL